MTTDSPTGSDGQPCAWTCHARQETPLQRLDRRYVELLQELRVAQTGVQVLLACLLALAFTPRFAHLTELQRWAYVASLMLGAASAAMLIAPVPYHRMVFARRLKRQLVMATAHYMVYGLLLLLLSLGAATLLVVDVLFAGRFAAWLTAVMMGWFGAWWYLLPMYAHHRSRTARPPTRAHRRRSLLR